MHLAKSQAVALALALLLAPPSGLLAADAAPPKVALEAEIAKLKSDDEAERSEARKQLAAKGEGIRAELQKALDGAGQDPDYAAQLKQVLKDLGQSEILRDFDAPQKVDLELKGKTVKDALTFLKKTYGFEVKAGDGALAKPLELDRKGLTFFEALEAIREGAKLGYRIDQAAANVDKKALCISLEELGEKNWVAAAAAGPFLVLVHSVSTNGSKTLDMAGGGNEHRQFNAQIQVIPFPGLTLGGVAPESGKFTDAKGNNFNGFNINRGRFSGMRQHRIGNQAIHLNDGFQLGADASAPFTWEATIKVQVPLKLVSKTLDDLSNGGQLDTPDGRVAVHKPEESGGKWKLKIVFPANSELAQGGWGGMGLAVRAGGGDAKPSKEQPGYFVLNAAGNVIQSQGMSGTGDGRTMTYDFTFGEEPRALQMNWHGEKTERAYAIKLSGIPAP